MTDPTGECGWALAWDVWNPISDVVCWVVVVTAFLATQIIKPWLEKIVDSLSNISTTHESEDKTIPENSKSNQSEAWQEMTGQWQTQTQSQVATSSPPPGGGNNGKKDDKKENRWSNRNTSTPKDYADVAKENWFKEVKWVRSEMNTKVYKSPDGKYYSPSRTTHNASMEWKIWEITKKWFQRTGTVNSNFIKIWK